jgi:hypothetical protein
MILDDVPSRELEQLFVIRSAQYVSAWAIDAACH